MPNLVGPSMLFTQLDHICDIQYASVITSDLIDPYHPGSSVKSVTFDTLTATYTKVKCRFISNTTIRREWFEQTTSGQRGFTGNRQATAIGEFAIIFDYNDVPSTMLDLTGTYNPTARHRIINIKYRNGEAMIDPGPFDIQDISGDSYGKYTVFLSLLRVK